MLTYLGGRAARSLRVADCAAEDASDGSLKISDKSTSLLECYLVFMQLVAAPYGACFDDNRLSYDPQDLS